MRGPLGEDDDHKRTCSKLDVQPYARRFGICFSTFKLRTTDLIALLRIAIKLAVLVSNSCLHLMRFLAVLAPNAKLCALLVPNERAAAAKPKKMAREKLMHGAIYG